jgi:hypothetical protein
MTSDVAWNYNRQVSPVNWCLQRQFVRHGIRDPHTQRARALTLGMFAASRVCVNLTFLACNEKSQTSNAALFLVLICGTHAFYDWRARWCTSGAGPFLSCRHFLIQYFFICIMTAFMCSSPENGRALSRQGRTGTHLMRELNKSSLFFFRVCTGLNADFCFSAEVFTYSF